MFHNSRLYFHLITNLSKSTIVRADLAQLKNGFSYIFSRNLTTENITHSTDVPVRKQNDTEHSSLYMNPLCMQMDQLIYTCTNHDQVLNLLVTHRGAMYLHNLITVMNTLRQFVENEPKNKYKPDCDELFLGYNNVFRKKELGEKSNIDLSNFSESEKEVIKKAQWEIIRHFEDPKNEEYLTTYHHNRDLKDAIIRDERYDLLLQDLYMNKNKLDMESMCNVIITLDALGHQYYRLYNGLLKRLLVIDISFPNKTPDFINKVGLLLLKTCHCFAKSGFYEIPLYNKVVNELFKTNLSNMLVDPEHSRLLSYIIRLYAIVKSYDCGIFYEISDSITKVKLSPSDATWLSVAFSNHLNFNKTHDRVLYYVAKRVSQDHKSFSTQELCMCLSSLTKMGLYFGEVWNVCAKRLISEIEVSMSGFNDIGLDINTLCRALYDIATVDKSTNLIHTLIDKASLYLEERIDSLCEESCINFAISVISTHSNSVNKSDEITTYLNETNELYPTSLYGQINLNYYLLSYVWRRIGTDLFWEKEPLKVFAIWLFHMLVLPEFKHNIHKRCILPCFREWLLVYFTRNEIEDEVCKVISDLSSKYKIYSKFDASEFFKPLLQSPIPADFIVVDENFGNKVINIIESPIRNDPKRPSGINVVIKRIFENFGLEFHTVDSNLWLSLGEQERTELIESIITNGI
uniref:RAP domain-containing protein n=1 Tax=Theileria annulata TaxID=5874 RepID=A0A3B0NAD8_THEAN